MRQEATPENEVGEKLGSRVVCFGVQAPVVIEMAASHPLILRS